jgi:hypothetical protein
MLLSVKCRNVTNPRVTHDQLNRKKLLSIVKKLRGQEILAEDFRNVRWGTRNSYVVDSDHVVVIALFGFVFRAVKRVIPGRNNWHKTARTGIGVVAKSGVVRGVFTRGVDSAFEHTFRGTLDVWNATLHFTTLFGPQGGFRAPLARWVAVAAVGATVQLHNIARACLRQTGTDGQPRVLFRATALFVVPVW